MRGIRLKLNMTTYAMAKAIGYAGKESSLDNQIRRLEGGNRKVPVCTARLLLMFEQHGVPKKFLNGGVQ